MGCNQLTSIVELTLKQIISKCSKVAPILVGDESTHLVGDDSEVNAVLIFKNTALLLGLIILNSQIFSVYLLIMFSIFI